MRGERRAHVRCSVPEYRSTTLDAPHQTGTGTNIYFQIIKKKLKLFKKKKKKNLNKFNFFKNYFNCYQCTYINIVFLYTNFF